MFVVVRQAWQWFWQRGWVPPAVLLVGLVASLLATVVLSRTIEAKDRDRFLHHVQLRTDSVLDRLRTYVALLEGAASLFAADPMIDRAEFEAYVERLDLRLRYPGVQGIGFSKRIAPKDLDATVTAMHQMGTEWFDVWPSDPRPEYHAIVYLEPLDRRNRAAIGYDMFTDATRREAMERARDTGQPAASGKVTLMQEIDQRKQAGLLIYVPIYAGGEVPQTVEARRAGLIGFAYSPFRAKDLISAIIGSERRHLLQLDLYDGATTSSDRLLYQTEQDHADAQHADTPRFTDTRYVTIAGRPWTIQFKTLPPFEYGSSQRIVAPALIVGVCTSFIMAGLALMQARARDRQARQEQQLAMGERARANALAEFEALINVLPVGIGIAYDARCRRIRTNASFARVLGLTVDQNASKTAPEAERPTNFRVFDSQGNEVPDDQLPMQLAAREGRTIDGVEYEVRHADGRSVRLLEYAAPLFDEHGRTRGSVGAFIDITERKASERQREHVIEVERAAREEAERVGRMKDEFLATLSHELRTPLSAILGWANMLRRGGLDGDDVSEGIQTIERNARVQAKIIEDLLDMSRIISGKVRLDVRRIDPVDAIEAAINVVRPSAEAKKIRLRSTLDAHGGSVRGDAGRLQQVLWNLLNNAVKFTPAGGCVDVVLRRAGGHVEISVSDTGQGIAPAFLPHVFERFRQADASITRRHGGLGLGLSIVKSLVELHGGSVQVNSSGEGHGATFTVCLPVAQAHADDGQDLPAVSAARPIEPTSNDCPSLAGLSVLVVDDEPDARDLLRRLIERCEARVLLAGSTDEALQMIAHERPDLIVSDIGMPQRDGYDLIRQVRELSPDQGGRTPAIALTALARADDRQRALLAGYQMHVAKPVEPDELIAGLASLAEISVPRPPVS